MYVIRVSPGQRLKNAIPAFSKMVLKAWVIPNASYVVTSNNNTILVNASTITITPGQYTITDLCSAFQTALGGGWTVTYSTLTQRVTITGPSSTIYWASYPLFARLFGYSSNQTGTSFVATAAPSCAPTLWYLVRIRNLPISSDDGYACMIPNDVGIGEVLTNLDGSEGILIPLGGCVSRLSSLDLELCDRDGNVLSIDYLLEFVVAWFSRKNKWWNNCAAIPQSGAVQNVNRKRSIEIRRWRVGWWRRQLAYWAQSMEVIDIIGITLWKKLGWMLSVGSNTLV